MKLKPPADTDYKKHYERGWRATCDLDAADARREPDAWYDGYFDLANGREKWHTFHCRLAGGCEVHERWS
jgi:hypothetical protein